MAAVIEGNSREAVMSSLFRTLTATIPRLHLLMKIRTENLGIEQGMRSIIIGEYLDFQKRRNTNLKHPGLRAHIIATFILSFLEWQREHPLEISFDEYIREINVTFSEYEMWMKKMLQD